MKRTLFPHEKGRGPSNDIEQAFIDVGPMGALGSSPRRAAEKSSVDGLRGIWILLSGLTEHRRSLFGLSQ